MGRLLLDRNKKIIFHKKRNSKWTFDPHTGQIGSRVIAIAPLQYILDETGAWKETNTMCWLRIEDVKSIIAKYEEYHPTNTIAQQIWYSYFLSSDKPGVVKTFY